MPDWPNALQGSVHEAGAADTANSRTVLVTSSASANTKGSWTELDASTAIDADGFWLHAVGVSPLADQLFDVAVGAGGSEVVILENVLFSGQFQYAGMAETYIPLPIKAGTRLAARCQSTTGSTTMTIGVDLAAGPFFASLRKGRATTYGAATADSGGVSVDPGGTAHTKGSWAELSSSITSPIEYAIICVGNQANSVRTDANHLLDIGVGAGGSEQVVLPNMHLRQNATLSAVFPHWRARHVSVKASARLAARQQSLITDATDRLFDVVVIGFD